MSMIFSVILFYFACALLRPLVVGGGSRIRAVVDSDNLEVGRLQINSGPMIDATGIGEIEIKNAVNTGIICAGVDTVNGSYLGTKTAQDLRVLAGYSEKARYLTTGEYGVGVLPIANEGLVQVGSAGATTRASGLLLGNISLFRSAVGNISLVPPAATDAAFNVARSTGEVAGVRALSGVTQVGSTSAHDAEIITGGVGRIRVTASGLAGVGVTPTASEGLLQVGTTSGTTRANGVRIGDVNLFRKGANILAVEGVAGSNVRLDVARSTGVIAHIHAQAAAVQFGSQSAHELALVTNDTARFRLSSTGDFHFAGGTPVARPTYGAPTGTATRTTFATDTVTTPQLAERVKALVDDLRAVGLFV